MRARNVEVNCTSCSAIEEKRLKVFERKKQKNEEPWSCWTEELWGKWMSHKLGEEGARMPNQGQANICQQRIRDGPKQRSMRIAQTTFFGLACCKKWTRKNLPGTYEGSSFSNESVSQLAITRPWLGYITRERAHQSAIIWLPKNIERQIWATPQTKTLLCRRKNERRVGSTTFFDRKSS